MGDASWGPLGGLRVLDFSVLLPGPAATVMLEEPELLVKVEVTTAPTSEDRVNAVLRLFSATTPFVPAAICAWVALPPRLGTPLVLLRRLSPPWFTM